MVESKLAFRWHMIRLLMVRQGELFFLWTNWDINYIGISQRCLNHFVQNCRNLQKSGL